MGFPTEKLDLVGTQRALRNARGCCNIVWMPGPPPLALSRPWAVSVSQVGLVPRPGVAAGTFLGPGSPKGGMARPRWAGPSAGAGPQTQECDVVSELPQLRGVAAPRPGLPHPGLPRPVICNCTAFQPSPQATAVQDHLRFPRSKYAAAEAS